MKCAKRARPFGTPPGRTRGNDPEPVSPRRESPVAIHVVRRCCRSADVVPQKESGLRAVLALARGVTEIPSSVFHPRGGRRSARPTYSRGAIATHTGI